MKWLVTLRHRVRGLDIWNELGEEHLLVCIERSQFEVIWESNRMLSGCLPLEGFLDPTGKRPGVDLKYTEWI